MNPSQPRTVSQEAAEEAEQLPASLKLGAVALTPPLDDERPVAPVCDWRQAERSAGFPACFSSSKQMGAA